MTLSTQFLTALGLSQTRYQVSSGPDKRLTADYSNIRPQTANRDGRQELARVSPQKVHKGTQ